MDWMCVFLFGMCMEAECHHGTWHWFSELGASYVKSTCPRHCGDFLMQSYLILYIACIKTVLKMFKSVCMHRPHY